MLRHIDACIEDVAPLSQVASEALTILGRADVDAVAAAEVLGRDQTLAARVLRLANSPFYGCTGRIATLREAFLVLGTRTVYQAVVAAAVMSSLDGDRPESVQRWHHSLHTAQAARRLAEGRVDPDLASTAGLLHDLGRIVLDNCMREEEQRALRQARRNGESTVAAELAVFGTDHAAVGAKVAARWRLPPSLVGAIGDHHAPDRGAVDVLVDVVHVADVLTHALELDEYPVPVVSEQAWSRLKLDVDEVEALFGRIDGGGGAHERA